MWCWFGEEDIHRCSDGFCEVASHSSSSAGTRGVLVFVWRTLNITILDVGCGADGIIAHGGE